MNIRAYIVKVLYPHCSDEVKILIDQMRNNPEKFDYLLGGVPYRGNGAWDWVFNSGHFEILDRIAVKHQSKIVHSAFTKQQILEGLLDAEEYAKNRTSNLNMFDSIKQPRTKVDYTSSVYADGRKPIK